MDAGLRGFRYNTAQKAAMRQLITRARDDADRKAVLYDYMLTQASLLEAEG
jgi:hypothetical protein